MRSIFGVLSLLVALAIVAVVVKKQLATSPASTQPTPGAGVGSTPQQTQQQFKQALDAAMQTGQKRGDATGDEK